MAAKTMPRLLLLPTLPAVQEGDRLILTAKFQSGWQAFVDAWPGPVDALFRPITATTNNLDNTAYRSRDLPGRAIVAPLDTGRAREAVGEADLVLGGTVVEQLELAEVAFKARVPFASTSEYTLPTRCQIARAEVRNPLKRWRRQMWERGLEKRLVAQIPSYAGLQCNGTPTFDAYQPLNSNTLLFFDSRIGPELLATSEELQARDERRRAGLPLRLAFSGRLIAMKGVGHLVGIARELERLGLDFDLEIFGDGELREPIERQLADSGLTQRVHLRGTVDFARKLIPHLRKEIDLFVCPHVQGDPSCTYLETWAAGVPIIGFDNEAFSGLLRRVDAGRDVPMGDERALAQAVVDAVADPDLLARWGRTGLEFASEHTAERSFRARVEHLVELGGSASRQSA